MASVTLSSDMIDIRFTGWERLWTGRERLAVAIRAVRHVAQVDSPLRLARGARSGYVVSGFVKIGVWGLFGGPRQLVAARRGEPGLHLVLDRAGAGGEFDEVVLSGPDAPGLAEAIGRAMAARA
ncbi:hypothetical protein SAMN05443287_102125 [Micromonospora phaseoli]|uniref:PH domain-containing protein n=1 Tax=Micromonospora phaseoli TaxID=1144548 RepID=A0A1H6U891_9ACTN|nr:hypothetical protein [Micromonospora phaseoli]PZV98890.1 hypothetical protein CLV64_104126 [Micromonospora phaseoli]GIJ76359.1 hypothetical protein Xph01_07910 [Micromonospora phaseoli]SEI87726.1 hypothetical protein SAMN05443287_102125 [Micromonospora phaseoli]